MNTLEFIKNEFLTNTVNIGSTFSKIPGSTFSDGPGLCLGHIFKVYHVYLTKIQNLTEDHQSVATIEKHLFPLKKELLLKLQHKLVKFGKKT